MPLEGGRIDMIEATIGLNIHDASEDELKITIANIKKALDQQVGREDDYIMLSLAFHQPSIMKGIEQYGKGPITVGEVRKGVLDLVNKKLSECIKNIHKDLDDKDIKQKLTDLEWDYDTLLETSSTKTDNEVKLITDDHRGGQDQDLIQAANAGILLGL